MTAPRFTDVEWRHIEQPVAYDVAYTRLDRDTTDFAHLINQQVEIDGAIYTVAAVERFAHMPPFKQGEGIGLAIRTK